MLVLSCELGMHAMVLTTWEIIVFYFAHRLLVSVNCVLANCDAWQALIMLAVFLHSIRPGFTLYVAVILFFQ